VTPLLVKLFVDQAVNLQESKRSLDQLPGHVTEVFLGLLGKINLVVDVPANRYDIIPLAVLEEGQKKVAVRFQSFNAKVGRQALPNDNVNLENFSDSLLERACGIGNGNYVRVNRQRNGSLQTLTY
jgi:hypothetical protein